MATRRVAALIGSSIGKIDKSDVLVDGDILVYNATTTKWDTKQMSASAAFVEAAQDAVAAMVVDSAEIDFTYVDATPSLTGVLINGSVAYARIVNASALSILGRSANSIGVLADIAAGADDRILRRTASTINFGQLTAGMFPALVVPDAALSANVALYNGTTAFTADQTISKAAALLKLTSTGAQFTGSLFNTNGTNRGYIGADGGTTSLGGPSAAVGDLAIRVESGRLLISLDGSTSTHHILASTAAGSSLNGIAVSDFARLSQLNPFTATISGGSAAYRNVAANPGIVLSASGAAANNREWRELVIGTNLTFQVSDDAYSAQTAWMTVGRTNNTIDSITLAATAVSLTGAALGINIAAPTVAGRVRTDGATPEYRLSRSTGTASDWPMYLPAGSTDLRFTDQTIDVLTLLKGGGIVSNGIIRTKGYTVATLPVGTLGDVAHVTDAAAPAFLVAVVGGGAVKSLVFFNGAAWVAA